MRISSLMLMMVVLGLSASSMLSSTFAGVYAYNYTTPESSNESIVLEGASQVLMPHMGLRTPGGNWTSPYDYYPLYTQNQTISGSIVELNNTSALGVAAVKLNTSSFNESLEGLAEILVSAKEGGSLKDRWLGSSIRSLNRTDRGRFAIPGLKTGLYALVVANSSSSSVVTAIPMLVTNEQLIIESVDKARLGDPLQVKLHLQGKKNQSRIYGAALVSEDDYRAIRIDMGGNGSESGITSQLTSGNQSLKLPGQPKVSLSQIEEIMPILPRDSALAMELSNRTESEMYMLTDTTWKAGRYVLTCGVYSSTGLDGIGQKTIEMVI